jgi:hypothetical protein
MRLIIIRLLLQVGISSATNGGFGSGSGSGLAGSGLFGNFATGTGNGQSFGK